MVDLVRSTAAAAALLGKTSSWKSGGSMKYSEQRHENTGEIPQEGVSEKSVCTKVQIDILLRAKFYWKQPISQLSLQPLPENKKTEVGGVGVVVKLERSIEEI